MGNTEKLMNQIMELKFTSKSLQRQSRKCEKEEKSEKLKVKKAIEKGNMDGARIYAENAIRKRTEQMNYLRLASRLDAVVARLDTQAKMTTISKSMGNIVKSLESSLATGNLQKMSETMDSFEKQFVNMEVQAEFMESAMAGSTSLSTPEGEVNSLMQQVADDYGLEVSVGLPQPAAHAVPAKEADKVDEDDLSRRLAELKARVQVLNVSWIMRRCEWVYAYCWTQESPRATTAEMQTRKRVNFELGLVSLLWGEGLRRVWSLR
ncbi:hypothetical protein JHK82_041162 [Glycine max]|nr:hypothetical protein JHK82_041162 [Glycine max]KAG5115319.1 hypothetical protein JHK84_041432 [Glycine max]